MAKTKRKGKCTTREEKNQQFGIYQEENSDRLADLHRGEIGKNGYKK